MNENDNATSKFNSKIILDDSSNATSYKLDSHNNIVIYNTFYTLFSDV